jgi:Tol biopolymer transport system component
MTNGEWIAFSYNPMPNGTQNKRDLYEINWKTGAQKQLTSGNKGINFPAFSPDGRSLVYSVCPGNDCYMYERDENGNETRLMDTQSFRPDWCQDPSKPWIIFENREDSKNVSIWMINLETHTPKRITNGPGDYGPDWSPDCSKFAFSRDTSITSDSGDIYIFDLSTNQEIQVTDTPEINEDSVSWSPKGEWLVFTQFKDDNNSGIRGDKGDNSDLTIIRPDGSGRSNLTSGKYDAYSPAWSPDESMIVFSASLSSSEPKNQISIFFRSSGEFESITGIGPYYHPNWSP